MSGPGDTADFSKVALALRGKRILITRSQTRAAEVVALLRSAAAEVRVAPTTTIEFLDSVQQRALAGSLVGTSWDWLFLTSANAVAACLAALSSERAPVSVLARGNVAVVGPSTAKALAAAGVVVDLEARGGHDAGSFAGALLFAIGGAQARILVPRARGGRDEAILRLRSAGCVVEVVDAYQSVPLLRDDPALLSTLEALRGGLVDAVVFYAPSQLVALCAAASDVRGLLQGLPVLGAVGPTTAAALEEQGLAASAVATSPSPLHMTQALARAFYKLSKRPAPT